MGWKGTVRSIGASYRSIQREEQRRQRELQKREKEIAKMEALQLAAYEVEVYENHIDLILSVHKESANIIDWKALKDAKEPIEPQRKRTNEMSFKAGFLTKILGNESIKKEKAIQKDDEDFELAYEQWKLDRSTWEENKLLASKLLSGDEESKIQILKRIDPFSDISELGSSLNFEIKENKIVEAILRPHGKDVVPSETKSLLQSGKLSVKKMPVGKFNEIFQDYICSCVLRIGNETLAIIPDQLILIHVLDEILNTKTGHMEEQCVVSVAISRDTIASLNMNMIDPSDSMENFVHNMKFLKTKGLQPVKKLQPSSFEC